MSRLHRKDLISEIVINLSCPLIEAPKEAHGSFHIFIASRSVARFLLTIYGEGGLEFGIDILEQPSDIQVHGRHHIDLWFRNRVCCRHDLHLTFSTLQRSLLVDIIAYWC